MAVYGLCPGGYEPAADLGWAVEITPVRVVDDAVTFRLVWARTRDEGKASTQSQSDRELTLRPGESIPLDSVHRPCPGEPRTIGELLRVTWSLPRSGLRSPADCAGSLACREAQRRYRAKPAAVAAWPVSPADSLLLRLDYRGGDGTRHLRRSHGGSGDRTSDVKIMTRSRIYDPNRPPAGPSLERQPRRSESRRTKSCPSSCRRSRMERRSPRGRCH